MSERREVRYAVWKFPLEYVDGVQSIDVPVGSKVLHVHEQHGKVCVWVQVEISPYADNHPSQIDLMIVGTGHPFLGYEGEQVSPASTRATHAVYRGTAHVDWTVWHVYQLQNSPD